MTDINKLIAELRQMVAAGERAELDYAPREHRVMREAADALEAQDKAIREALGYIQPSTLMRSTEPGYNGTTRDVRRARRILSSVLEQTTEPPEPEWEYGTVIGPLDAGWVTANLTRERALEKAADTRVKRTAVRRRAPGPWEALTPEGSGL
jgi:hypothetical protein